MDFILQLWGGGFYLLNKILFALAEGEAECRQRKLRIAGWSVYLLGVPAWVMILLGKHNWIAASIESGGVPAMLFGLYNVIYNPGKPNRTFDLCVTCSTYLFLLFGISYSLYDYGGIRTGTQLLEIGVTVGFLLGSYLLARKNYYGWLFFVLMNGSMATLMLVQQKPILAFQQLVSLGFVLYGYVLARRSAQIGRKKR